ncbi:MAG: sigma 54-interacting transcriptional regulator [Planctomycetota bacterium]|nr:sigma 54-interacting transcriptional regulator [Planctomycetota bacterium]
MIEHQVSEVDSGRFLLCATDAEVRQRLRQNLDIAQATFQECDTLAEIRRLVLTHEIDVCIVDGSFVHADVELLADELAASRRTTQFVHLQNQPTGPVLKTNLGSSLHRVVAPHEVGQLVPVVTLAFRMARSLSDIQRLRRQLQHRLQREMLGNSTATQELREAILRTAEKDDAVLILGESGTGLTMTAQAVHDVSRRAHRPFIKLRCSVLSTEAIEAELFGRVVDIAPGQQQFHPGLLELAEGGTLLLQNVEALSIPLQKKIVRMFLEKRYHDPATGTARRLNIRLIATSHAEPDVLAKCGLIGDNETPGLEFVTLKTSPLCSRTEDIGLLAEHFLNGLASEEGRPPRMMTLDALELLKSYSWPGNIRQLNHVLERACGVDAGTRLTADVLRPWMEHPTAEVHTETVGMSLRDMERKLIEATFNRYGGNRERTAQALQIGLRTLSGKLREYGYPPRGGPGSNRHQSASRAA